MKHKLLFSIGILLLIVLIFYTGCDDISSQPDPENAKLESLEISPHSINFDSSSEIGEQSVSFDVTLTTAESADSDFIYTLTQRGEIIREGDFGFDRDRTFTASFSLSLNTAESHNFTLYAFSPNDTSGERIQGGITVRGRTVSPPIVEEAFNTEEVTIPQSGRERIDFFARVVHPDNQDFIDEVNFFLVDQQGNQLRENFEMFDDGDFNESEGRIDEAAGDSLYSRALFIEPTNNPDNVSVFYFAVGIDGQSSDTLQTQLRIVE